MFGNPNVMCYLNQALCALCYSGSWWARTLDVRNPDGIVSEIDDEIGENIIHLLCVLQQPSLDEEGHFQMEVDRDVLATQLFPGVDVNVVQQDLLECLHVMLGHIDGTETCVNKFEYRTCNCCHVSSSRVTTLEHIVLGKSNEAEVDIQDLLNAQIDTGRFKCSTAGCIGDS